MEKEPFIIIPKSIATNKKLSSSSKLLYGIIASLCRQKGNVCFASNEYFCNELGINKRTVPRLVNELSEEKLIISVVSKFKEKYKRRITIIPQLSNDPNKPF